MFVPDRWRDYCNFHQCIDETRILAVKTPLREGFNNGLTKNDMECRGVEHGIPLEEEFTPTNLIEGVASMGHGYRLGLVIDLTNTNRYYNREEFLSVGVEYEKLKCAGQQTPSEDIYTRLSERLSSFLSENETGIAVVHCTHGLNRTGYLVCRYLVEYCDYKVRAAIKAFEKARGHQIEKYKNDLRRDCSKQHHAAPPSKGTQHSLDEGHGGHDVGSKVGARICQRGSGHTSYGEQRRPKRRGDYRSDDRRQFERQGSRRREDNPNNDYHYTNDHVYDSADYYYPGARGKTSRDHRESGMGRHDLEDHISDQYSHSVLDQYHVGSFRGSRRHHRGIDSEQHKSSSLRRGKSVQ